VGTTFKITPTGHVTTLWNFTGTGPDEGKRSFGFSGAGRATLRHRPGSLHGNRRVLYKMTPGRRLLPPPRWRLSILLTGCLPTFPTQGRRHFYGTAVLEVGTACSAFWGWWRGVTSHSCRETDDTARFTGFPVMAVLPSGVLVQGADGSFYGTTFFGGGRSHQRKARSSRFRQPGSTRSCTASMTLAATTVTTLGPAWRRARTATFTERRREGPATQACSSRSHRRPGDRPL